MKALPIKEAVEKAKEILTWSAGLHEKHARQLFVDARGSGFRGLSQNTPGIIEGMSLIEHDRAAKKLRRMLRALED